MRVLLKICGYTIIKTTNVPKSYFYASVTNNVDATYYTVGEIFNNTFMYDIYLF